MRRLTSLITESSQHPQKRSTMPDTQSWAARAVEAIHTIRDEMHENNRQAASTAAITYALLDVADALRELTRAVQRSQNAPRTVK